MGQVNKVTARRDIARKRARLDGLAGGGERAMNIRRLRLQRLVESDPLARQERALRQARQQLGLIRQLRAAGRPVPGELLRSTNGLLRLAKGEGAGRETRGEVERR